MKDDQLQKLLKNLDKNTEITRKVENNIKEINKTIKYAPTDIINSFIKYTEPQKNISEIINFYKTVIECTEKINEEMKRIDALEDNTDQNQIIAINAHYNIKDELRKLENYSDLNAIARLKEKTNKKIYNIVETLFTAFFKGFEKGRDTKDLKIISRFLLENDETSYLLKYVKIMFHKYSIKKDERDSAKVLDHLKNLKKTYGEIHRINVIYMDDAKTEILDKQIQQMLLIEYKDIISKILMDLENKYKDKNIVDACNWYLAVKDKEIASLFGEFDEEILKDIYNLQIKFLNNIDAIPKPNKKLLNEDFVYNLFRIFNLFENEELHAFFDLYRSELDYKNYDEMKAVLSGTALDKIFNLSAKLKGIQKNVYLLNNIYLMINYCKEYQGKKLVEYISRYCDEIVKMWKDECDKRKGDITQFLDVNFEIQKDYYLPEEIRTVVLEGIERIVLGMMERCTYKNGKEMLEMKMHQLYKGK